MYHNKSFTNTVYERSDEPKSVELLSLAIGVVKTGALKDDG